MKKITALLLVFALFCTLLPQLVLTSAAADAPDTPADAKAISTNTDYNESIYISVLEQISLKIDGDGRSTYGLLYDIDENGIRELIVHYLADHTFFCTVYTIQNGTAVELLKPTMLSYNAGGPSTKVAVVRFGSNVGLLLCEQNNSSDSFYTDVFGTNWLYKYTGGALTLCDEVEYNERQLYNDDGHTRDEKNSYAVIDKVKKPYSAYEEWCGQFEVMKKICVGGGNNTGNQGMTIEELLADIRGAAGDDWDIFTECGGNTSICPSAKFWDVAPYGDWSHNGIDFCIDRGLFGGTSATTFEPETAMTRAMLVTVLWRYQGSPKGYSNSFTDVKTGEWYADAVSWASSNSIVNGIGGGRFDPKGIVTREQMATILYRYSEWSDFDTSARTSFSSFPDAAKVSPWAKDAMQWAVAENLIGGSKAGGKTYILPADGATRAQVATILMRFIQNIAEEKPYDLKGHTYEYICGKHSWSEAQAIAKEKGGYLVHFDDLDEFNYVTRQLNRKGYRDIVFLIGGRRADDSHDYFWVDTNDKPIGDKLNSPEAWCSPLWYSGEPTFEWQGVEECCMQLEFKTDISQWVFNDIDEDPDYPADPNLHGFIIEFE